MNERLLRGIELRYVLVRVLQVVGPCTVPELLAVLRYWGFTVAGRPSKTVSDALRWERQRGRVGRSGRGRYRLGWMPRGTEHRIHTRVEALRIEALSLKGGQQLGVADSGPDGDPDTARRPAWP